jgi:FkbM family methyltransferase
MPLRLSTRSKLSVARLLYWAVRSGRLVLGRRDDEVRCRRGGIDWRLDLREGIDLSIYLFGHFERGTTLALRRELSEGDVVLDVGANIGSHTLPMAAQVGSRGRVHAFEATEWAHSRLLRNLELNPRLAASVSAVHALLGDGREDLPEEIYSSWNVMEFDRPGRPPHGGGAHPVGSARRVSLDAYFAPAPLARLDLVKMDVDGFEPLILAGARETLKRHRPRILLELCPDALRERGFGLGDLVEPLASAGYRLLGETSRRELEWGSVAELERRIPTGGSINVLAEPRDRSADSIG